MNSLDILRSCYLPNLENVELRYCDLLSLDGLPVDSLTEIKILTERKLDINWLSNAKKLK